MSGSAPSPGVSPDAIGVNLTPHSEVDLSEMIWLIYVTTSEGDVIESPAADDYFFSLSATVLMPPLNSMILSRS